ncbi:MAG: hypothetical protein ACPG5L_09875 [Vibrio gallaecicus]|uniref:Outer membrane protein beta-barrel domain-containing protein n=2 Tax=Vibrio gallaecicus TaxID=552386 RepID=A0ABV4NHY1_9VIBR|nr:hypothetical protein [Vibrio gallaecicus]
MKKFLCFLALFPSISFAEPNLYFGADYLTNDSKYALQYGFYFKASPELDFGYEWEYAQYSNDMHSLGINIKPSFPHGDFYIAPIGGFHYFSGNVNAAFVYGAEVGYRYNAITLRAGYKEASEDFKNSDNVYVGAGINF